MRKYEGEKMRKKSDARNLMDENNKNGKISQRAKYYCFVITLKG